jgi:uncharacterized protein YjbJ (UPF0337 family)
MTTERDRYEGKGKEALGSLKEKAGEVSGDEEMEAEGKGEKYEGKGQEAWGKVKETMRETKEKVTD